VEKTDVLIVGGGIIGTSAAYFLSKQGVDVTLIERFGIGRGASGASAGSMALQNKELKVIPLSQEALRVWAQLQSELDEDLEFRQTGGLRVAENDSQLQMLKQSIREQKRKGLKADVEILSANELKSFAPYLGTSVVAASYCSEDSKGNPLLAVVSLAKAARTRGAKIHTRETVKGISITGADRFTVHTSKNTYQSRFILNAAGVWAKDIFNMVRVDVSIRLSPMQAMITEKVSEFFSPIITHVSGKLTIKQMDNGSVLIGGGWEGIGDAERFIARIRLESLAGNIQYAGRVIPSLANLRIIRCWTGLEGRSPDLYPLLGSLHHIPNFYCACCAKGGFTMGPALGKLVSELIVEGKTSFPIKAFDVNRAVQIL